jgi:hypothetical protein
MKAIRALLLRLVYTVPVVWLVVSIVFLLIHLVPGDPIQQMLGDGARPADVSALRHSYGLDLPLGTQYTHYWRGVLHGDLGHSLRLNDSVTHLVLVRYPYTVDPPGLAARLRRCRPGVPDPSGGHHGQRAGGDPDPHGAHRDAGRVGAGLHPHRAREGPAGANGCVPACAA